MSGGRVAVIVPAYNAAATLAEALQSVSAQAWADLEVWVVDDRSGDGTADVARAFNPAPHVIEMPRNAGPAAARNAALARAETPWVAFLDADDAWLPWRLSLQMRVMEANPDAAMCCGRAVGSDAPAAEPDVAAARARRLSLDDFTERNPVATSTVLARADALRAAGGFDERFRGPEDYDLWIRVAARGAVLQADAPLARYRRRPGSLSMDDLRFHGEVLRVLRKAFGPGGALHGMPGRSRAVAYQHLACAWMAAERGAIGRAYALFAASLLCYPSGRFHTRRWARARLLANLIGRRRGRE